MPCDCEGACWAIHVGTTPLRDHTWQGLLHGHAGRLHGASGAHCSALISVTASPWHPLDPVSFARIHPLLHVWLRHPHCTTLLHQFLHALPSKAVFRLLVHPCMPLHHASLVTGLFAMLSEGRLG